MRETSPSFQFIPSDFLADGNTLVMSAEEIGAYTLLMCVCWRETALSTDIEELAAIARMDPERFRESWERRIKRCFRLNDDGTGYIHPRLDRERQRQEERRQSQSENGKRGAAKRYGQKGENGLFDGVGIVTPQPPHGEAIATHIANDSSSSSSSFSSSDNTLVDANASTLSAEADAADGDGGVDVHNRDYSRWKESVRTAWNRTMDSPPFTPVMKLSGQRERHLRARYGEAVFRERYPEIFSIVNESPFCRGSGKTGFIASFDWIIKNDANYTKVLEGKYTDRTKNHVGNDHRIDKYNDRAVRSGLIPATEGGGRSP
ncbi:MAG TPA: DUF1376 domain-containing protein [Bacteroidota bacterium]|nr:DUF1376 domain-containing protein [Bacteroidota bacterium]